jgi:hypothetical protein
MTIVDSFVFNDVGDDFSQATGNSGTININTGSLSLNNAASVPAPMEWEMLEGYLCRLIIL